MSTIFTSDLANSLKDTLEGINDDDLDGAQSKAVFPKWCEIRTMSDHYEDDLEMAGPGVLAEKPEGTNLQGFTLQEGTLTRYYARTFGGKMMITEEAQEDAKYPEAIRLALRLKRAIWKTADYDATNILARMFSTAYPGGDGLPLCSASHTLPQGGTFSNLMAVPMSPSVAALIVAISQIRKFTGHDGTIEGVEAKKIVCPTEQWGAWAGVVGSQMRPDTGNFAEINVIKPLNLEVVPVKYWTNTTTNWGIVTDAEMGVNFRWRRRPRARTWMENDNETIHHSNTARWSRGWTDPRGFYGVNL